MESASADPLHEFVDIEISVPGSGDPARQSELAEVLQNFRGIRSLSIAGGKVALTYEPVLLTKAEVLEAIRGAGFEIGAMESSSSSPVSDALEKIVIEGTPIEQRQRETGSGHEG